MIKFLHRLLLISVLLLPFAADAQTRKAYDLGTDMGLSFMQSKLQVKNLVADTNAAKTRWPQFYAHRKWKGKTGVQFMHLSAFDVAFGEATWQGQGGGAGSTPTGVLNSNNHITVPSGEYWCTITAQVRGMQVYGQGAGYVGTDGKNSVNTKLVVWHEQWQDDPNERHLMQTDTWNKGKGNTYYSEGLEIKYIAFEGRQHEFPSQTFNSSGLRLWYPGEVTTIDHLYPRNFRTAGIECFGSTPLNAGVVSVFDNVVAGVIFYGSGSTVNWNLLSGDDNGAMFICDHGYADTGGGAINFGAIKNETFVASQGRVHRGMVVGIIRGQATVNIGVVSGYSGAGYVNAAFVVDTRSPYHPPQNMSLNVGGFKVKQYKHMVHQIASTPNGLTSHYWSTRGDYTADGFSWSSYGGGVFEWNVSTIPTIKVAHTCTEPVAFGKTAYPTGCTAQRLIIDGPPRNPTTIYVGDVVTPTPTPCTYTYTAWGDCVNGTQTRMVVTATPTGCTGNPGPLSQPCTVTPPPTTTTAINPNDVVVVANTQDPLSAAMATAYMTAWGIPLTNIVQAQLGVNEELTTKATLDALRASVAAKGKEYTVLAFTYPSRYTGGQSITSAVTFGARNVSSLTVSPLYGYTGTKPRTDKGFAPSALLRSVNYIRRDVHKAGTSGMALMILAKDQTGTPRGSARAAQTAPGLTVWDNRSVAGIGNGSNPCNYLSNACWIAGRKPTGPILAAYQSMFNLGDDSGVQYVRGYYGDHLTSTGGNLPTGAGQTPLTYHMDRGASFSVGTVTEPWQDRSGNSPGSLVEQFVDVSRFHPLFVAGNPVGAAAWSAVKCPDRALFVGDLMFQTK